MEFALFFVFVFYIVPWIIAVSRDHDHYGAILAFNLLLGWTGIGWWLALFWAFRSPEDDRASSRPIEAKVVPLHRGQA